MVRRTFAAAATLLLLIVAAVSGALPASAADPTADLQIQKTASSEGPFRPGATFSYTIVIGCSSANVAGCVNAKVSDQLPAPLVFDPDVSPPVTASISPSAGGTGVDVDSSGNSFTVKALNSLGGDTGLVAGGSMSITVNVKVPDDVSADYDGDKILNTAKTTADNADEQSGSAQVTLSVPTTLLAGIDKRVRPSTVPAVPGKAVEWTNTVSNRSNQTVDKLVVEDRFDGANQDLFDFTGVTTTPAPATTTSTSVEYLVGGSWQSTEPADPADVEGVRVTYTGTYAPGASGEVRIAQETNAGVNAIPADQSVVATNTADATAGKGSATSPVVDDSANVNVVNRPPSVTVEKTMENTRLVVGETTTSTIQSTVGEQYVHELVINEPGAGQPGFTDQGVEFTGFDADAIEWPIAAVSASITYTYSDCASTTESTTTADTLPGPQAGCTVEGFSITYTAATGQDGIEAGAYAVVPMKITALTNIDEPISSTNHADSTVTTTDGQSGDDDTSVDFTVNPLDVFTEVAKQITPDEIYAAPGANANVSLPAKVSSDSTIGADELVISDPASPPSDFFDTFTVPSIKNTDVPACSSLTVNYWSTAAGAWVPLPGGQVTGPAEKWGVAISPAIQADLGGIQFVFKPAAGDGCSDLLVPGFNVIPSFGIQAKPGIANEDATFTNDVESSVTNNQIAKTDTDTASDTIDVVEVPPGGPDLVDKTWLNDDVPALSGQTRTARINWTTAGLNFAQVQVTDPASATDGSMPPIASSVYDAFNLVRIKPITPATDPLIAGDRVSKVELNIAGLWADVTSQACPTAAACTGTFPGLQLTAAQQADVTGVKITFAEQVPGAGVNPSTDNRPIDLDFAIRDTLRSDPTQYVLGTFHPYTYNTGQPGLVNNTVRVTGSGGVSGDFTSTDGDTITIIDSPVNVDAQKSFDQSQLGLPAAGTDADDYPLIDATLTGTNTSAVRISSLAVSDPSPTQADPTAYEVLDLHDIASITLPAGLTAADTTVFLTSGGVEQGYSYADALALTPADLADVTAVRVLVARADGAPVIAPSGQVVVKLVYQLRAQERTSSAPVTVTTAPILNVAYVEGDSPGRIVCPAVGCSPGTDEATGRFNIVDASYAVAGSKSISPNANPSTTSPTSVYEDQSNRYTTTLTGQPQGNARAVLLTLTDDTPTFWNVMDYVSASVVLPTPVNQAKAWYLVDVAGDGPGGGDDTWTEGDWQNPTSGTTVNFTVPSSVDASRIVGVRYDFRRYVSGQVQQWERPYNPRIPVKLITDRRADQRGNGAPVSTTRPGQVANEGETTPGTISNVLTIDSTGQFGERQTIEADQVSAAASTIVRHRVNAIRVEKSPGNPGNYPLYAPSGTVPYVLTVTNIGEWDITGLTIEDQFGLVNGQSPVVEPSPTQYGFSLTTTGTALPNPLPTFSATFDEATAKLTVNLPTGFVFRPGWKLTITAPMKFAPGITADTVVQNGVTATSDRDFEACRYTTDRLGQGSTSNVSDCTATTHVQPLASAPLSMDKSVKGDGAGAPDSGRDDLGVYNPAGAASDCLALDGFYTSQCLPITRPGGEETWRLRFLNSGNTNAKVVAAVDTLPAVNDRGVITSSGRGSQFAVTLRHGFSQNIAQLRNTGATIRAYYSNARLSQSCNTNAIQVHTAAATADPSCAFNWTEYTASTPNSELANAQSVKFVVDWSATPGAGLEPGERLSITFNTRTPTSLPRAFSTTTALPVAYNSFAGASRTVATNTQGERPEIVLEPTKAGIATAVGRLTVAKSVVAPDYSVPITLPTSYTFNASCTSDGEPVTLRRLDGTAYTGPITVNVTDNAGSTVLNSIALPISVPLFAQCTLTETPVPTGATVTWDPTSRQVMADGNLRLPANRVRNPYEGEFNGPTATATNTYAAGGFTVTKDVDNGGAVDQDGTPIVYGRDFSFDVACQFQGSTILTETIALADGGSKSYTGLPTGSTCTVQETDAAPADATVTIDGEPATNPAQVTVGDDTDVQVGFTNTFDVGSVTITKDVVGPGAAAWGTEPFEVRLVCTLAAATPTTVYDDTHTLQAPDDLEWTVQNLPEGASCVVTEPKTGGANDVDIDPTPVTVVPGQQAVDVDVTNTFDQGSVQVTKELNGAGADFPPISNGTYVMTIACTRDVDGQDLPVAIPGGADRTITGPGTATWDGLPTGAECTVSEKSSTPPAQTTELTPVDGKVVVPAGDAAAAGVVVDNTFNVGYLRINKVIDGPGQGFHGSDSFTFDVTCTLAGATLLSQPVTLTRVDGSTSLWSDVLGPLPTGTSCAVVETKSGSADVAAPEATVVISTGDEAQAVVATLTNRYGAGGVEVTKRVTGKYAESSEVARYRFALTLTCQLETTDPQGVVVRGTVLERAFTLRAGATRRFDESVPTGSHCFLAETDDGGASAVRIPHGSFETGAVVPRTGERVDLSLVATNVFNSDLAAEDLEASDDGTGLADTGADVPPGLLAAGLFSLLAGAGVLSWRGRRSRQR